MKFLSEKTNKSYSSVEELEKAEAEFDAAEKAKADKKNELTVDLKTVENAANEYLAVCNSNNEQRAAFEKKLKDEEQKAWDAYQKAIDAFADKHNGYKLTYTTDGKTSEFKVMEVHEDEIEARLNRELAHQRAILERMLKNCYGLLND